MSLPRAFKAWIFAACGLVVAQVVASLLLRQGYALIVLSDVGQCFLLVSGTLALALNILANRGRTRFFWALMTLGLIFWMSYQFLWTYIEVILRQDVPDPFGGDAVLFVHLVPMMAALALKPQAEHDERTTRLGALDFALLLLWWLYLYLFAVIPWQYVTTLESAYGVNFNTLYLVEKLVLLAGLLTVLLRSEGFWRNIYTHWFGASLVYALSSYVANWAIQHKTYYSGSLYDIPLAASMAWITAIGVLSAHRSAHQESPRRRSNYGVWVARLGMVAIFSLPLFAAWSLFDSQAPPAVRTFRLEITLAAMLVMGCLVFLKQHLLDSELLRLLHESRESFENLQRLQTQLVQSEKLASLGQLVGGAAHELNNPLTAMLGYSDLLLETPLTGEQRSLAEKIVHQVRRTRTLVSNLLSFAKQVPARKIPIDVNALAQTAVKLCQPQLCARNIQVHTELTGGLPKILGDSNQLLQVCLHITNNALNAMTESGSVLTVSTRREENFILLEYSDDGPGMSEPERVFDPFYTTRPVGQGMGLGLSACYGIVQEHGGKIACENRSEGGATFWIALPVIGKVAAIMKVKESPQPIAEMTETEAVAVPPPS